MEQSYLHYEKQKGDMWCMYQVHGDGLFLSSLTQVSRPELYIWLLYLIFTPCCAFFVNGCSSPHFIELNFRQVRRISQIRYRALESHRETIKPWNMCLAVSEGGSAAWEVGKMVCTHAHSHTHTHAKHDKKLRTLTKIVYCFTYVWHTITHHGLMEFDTK